MTLRNSAKAVALSPCRDWTHRKKSLSPSATESEKMIPETGLIPKINHFWRVIPLPRLSWCLVTSNNAHAFREIYPAYRTTQRTISTGLGGAIKIGRILSPVYSDTTQLDVELCHYRLLRRRCDTVGVLWTVQQRTANRSRSSQLHNFYRASAYWRAILIYKSVRPCVCLSVCPSVRYVPVLYENGLTYCHSFFTIAQSF